MSSDTVEEQKSVSGMRRAVSECGSKQQYNMGEVPMCVKGLSLRTACHSGQQCFVAGWRHALWSEWPILIFLYTPDSSLFGQLLFATRIPGHVQPVGRPCGTWMHYAMRDGKDMGQQMGYRSLEWNWPK